MVEKAVKTIVASLRNPVNVDLGKCRELTRSDDELYIVYIFYFVLLCFRFLTGIYQFYVYLVHLSVNKKNALRPHISSWSWY